MFIDHYNLFGMLAQCSFVWQLALEEVELVVQLKDIIHDEWTLVEMYVQTLKLLRLLADSLMEGGIELSVARIPTKWKNNVKPFIKAGWNAPMPHAGNYGDS
ncbi:hypothetical protein SNOG_20008 [Parastagonospora nodorum SN15]|uniref:Uncharacterized protein n=1 Tax=Phaeosphaeria nodorum (strain SN15 / ATCC MYA-4574 / FGSC 10173) TaxID=321614 RepID=A9JU02_PHANO|nr:hypothetical protein SNOG_20008 [Parastagonospora nodorum SN15]EDP89758.1 hypothetical protein SNOG_20008 [Parastagonospora nodorum SN15]